MQCNYYQYWGGWKASRRASLNGSWKGPSLIITLIIERLHDKVAADDEKKSGGTLVWAAWWAKIKYFRIWLWWGVPKAVRPRADNIFTSSFYRCS